MPNVIQESNRPPSPRGLRPLLQNEKTIVIDRKDVMGSNSIVFCSMSGNLVIIWK